MAKSEPYIPWGFSITVPMPDDEASLAQAEQEGWDYTIGEHPIVMVATRKTHKIPLISINGVILSEREVVELDLTVTVPTEQDDREAWPSSYNPADGWSGKIIGFLPERVAYLDKSVKVCEIHFLHLSKTGACGDSSCRKYQ